MIIYSTQVHQQVISINGKEINVQKVQKFIMAQYVAYNGPTDIYSVVEVKINNWKYQKDMKL